MADGLNNLSDMGSSVIALIGFKMAGKPADSDHPYGHGRIEYLSAFLVSMCIMLVGSELFIGSAKSLISLVVRLVRHRTINIVVELGKTLALALEFKMGAEIIKTVIVHDLTELAVLGIVILIRALLAFLIHWEMKMEKNEEKDNPKAEKSE
jgi:divalent metal cation (Fe/Co/Zn/Cd) transporter